jgi:hypothetical protein
MKAKASSGLWDCDQIKNRGRLFESTVGALGVNRAVGSHGTQISGRTGFLAAAAPSVGRLASIHAASPPSLDNHSHAVEHLVNPNRARSPIGNTPVPQRPVPIGISGHLGNDFQEPGGLARRLHQRQFETTSGNENDLGFTRRLVLIDRSDDGLLEW